MRDESPPADTAPEAARPRVDTAPFGGWERAVAFRYLGSRKAHAGVAAISMISFIGVLLAVAVLIIVMSVMNGFRAELLSRILGVESHARVFVRGLDPPTVIRLSDDLSRVSGVTSAIPTVDGQVMASARGVFRPALVKGVAPADLTRVDYVLDSIVECGAACGSAAAFGEGRLGGDQVLVGRSLANALGLAPGDRIALITLSGDATVLGTAPRRKAYEIAATFEVGSELYDAGVIYMPLEQSQVFFGRRGEVDVIEVRIEDPDGIGQALPDLRTAAAGRALIEDWRDRHRQYFTALKVERNVMRLILMLIVAIAAMNIIAGLVMLVKNKGRDIAILRTMGATRGAILRVFFMAGATIGLLGTLGGLIVGVLFALNIETIQGGLEWMISQVTGRRFELFPGEVYQLNTLPALIEWREVAVITGWGALMSCLATLAPAWRASRLSPVEALRYE